MGVHLFLLPPSGTRNILSVGARDGGHGDIKKRKNPGRLEYVLHVTLMSEFRSCNSSSFSTSERQGQRFKDSDDTDVLVLSLHLIR